jgi:hypothetical protein
MDGVWTQCAGDVLAGTCTSGSVSFTAQTVYPVTFNAATKTITVATDGADFSITWDGDNDYACSYVGEPNRLRTININDPDGDDGFMGMSPTKILTVVNIDTDLGLFQNTSIRDGSNATTPICSVNQHHQMCADGG